MVPKMRSIYGSELAVGLSHKILRDREISSVYRRKLEREGTANEQTKRQKSE
jgi:hypothetical protein